jgi:DNA repair protein RadC
MARHRRAARPHRSTPPAVTRAITEMSPFLRDADDALDAIHLSATDPCGDEIVALLLDRDDRVITSLSVTDLTDDDAVVHVCEMLSELRREEGLRLRGVVFAQLFSHGGHLPTAGDEARWRLLVDRCASAPIALRDWFLVCDGAATSMAEWMGAPDPWADDRA